MWRRKREDPQTGKSGDPASLKEALRKARVEQAERTGTVIDLRDAELARLELLNEALDPVFASIPGELDLFDRGLSQGETPRLWIDSVAHIGMARDKRMYRFLQDTRYGRRVLAESVQVNEIVHAVTKYLAQRLVDRERVLAERAPPESSDRKHLTALLGRTRQRRVTTFLFGLLVGWLTLSVAALLFG